MKCIQIVFFICVLGSCNTDRSDEIDKAMRHYDRLILHGQYDSIANMYSIDGELVGGDQPSVFGRDSISKFLKSFKGATVLKNESTTKTTIFKGSTAVQEGSYIQIVKIPSGDTLEMAGQYTTTWIGESENNWQIKKMFTHHYRNLKEEKWLDNLSNKSIAKLYGKSILSEGQNVANDKLKKLKSDSANYYLSENELNHLGYFLMGKNKDGEALEVFKETTLLFPASWNAFDSYGESLLKNNKRDEAIKMYQKSVGLNSKNENGTRVLNQLLK